MPSAFRKIARCRALVLLLALLSVVPGVGSAAERELVSWDALLPRSSQGGAVQSQALPQTSTPSQTPLPAADPFDPFNDGRPVVEEWGEQDYDAAASVLGKDVLIDGYVLPLAWKGDRVVEFLLVPWVGACIHTPAPPPNQIIHVAYADGLVLDRQFEAVRLTGTLQYVPALHDLFLVDGQRQIPVAFALENAAPAGVPGEVVASSATDLPFVARAQIWVNALFTDSMRAIGTEGSSKALLLALLLSFGYGALHTLGPGHGKAVVISYFVGTGGSLRRGLSMGVRIAVIHVLSAVVVVFLLDLAIRQTTGAAPSDYHAIRLASYALIMAIGAAMLWQAIRATLAARAAAAAPAHAHHTHEHAHDHDHHHHDHAGHAHAGCSACAAAAAPKGSGWIAASVGLVPCTGALLVMLFGLANDLVWPAILMVVAISAGMAVAMSAIGMAALAGRALAERRFAGNRDGALRFELGARLAGAACVFAIGAFLFAITLAYQPIPRVPVNDVATRTLGGAPTDG